MATVKTLFSGSRKLAVNITGAFDTTDETDVVVVDKSTLTGMNGSEPSKLVVEEITWAIGPFNYVLLEWDHTTDEVIEYLQGQGYMDYRPYGGKVDGGGAGDTGDILLSTSGGAAGDTYSIYLVVRLKD